MRCECRRTDGPGASALLHEVGIRDHLEDRPPLEFRQTSPGGPSPHDALASTLWIDHRGEPVDLHERRIDGVGQHEVGIDRHTQRGHPRRPLVARDGVQATKEREDTYVTPSNSQRIGLNPFSVDLGLDDLAGLEMLVHAGRADRVPVDVGTVAQFPVPSADT
jgi:hypothetical protein